MKRRIDLKKLNQWIANNGGILAENKLREVTGYSLSTLQKMKDGSYMSCPGFAERAALTQLTKYPMDVLFPVVSDKGKAS